MGLPPVSLRTENTLTCLRKFAQGVFSNLLEVDGKGLYEVDELMC